MADWAAQVRAAGQTPVVLDVREDFEIEASAVDAQATQQGFEMLYMPMWQIPQRLNDLPDEDAPLAILCHHGQPTTPVVVQQTCGWVDIQRGATDQQDVGVLHGSH